MIHNEIWKEINGYEGLYEVSNLGRIRSLYLNKSHKGVIRKLHKRKDGYMDVSLSKNSKIRIFKVHRIVAKAFLPNPDNMIYINHIDESKENNASYNLEWCTRSYNINYGSIVQRTLINRKSSKTEIGQYTIDGYFIQYWKSIRSAAKATGISKSAIQKCLKDDLKSAGCFIWKQRLYY